MTKYYPPNDFWKCVARKFGFVFVWMQNVKYFTAIDTFSWLGGQEVMYGTAVPAVPGSISSFEKKFYVCFFVLLLPHIYFLGPKTIIFHAMYIFLS